MDNEEKYRSHQLLERFFVDVLNLDRDKAHEEAKKLSEIMSTDVVEAIDLLMQHPAFCPDGNVIPGEEEHPKNVTTICEMSMGEEGKVVQLGYGMGQRRHLQSVGLREGKVIRIKGMQPRGGPIVVDVGGIEIAIGRRMAARIFIERVSK
ncbi:MAG: FeoA domain-containing protein [Thermoplasmata archaeon]|nr:FeoA domain-containing protein [Thermoplasmata archaeon]